MKEPDLVKAIEKVVTLKLRAVDKLVEELVEPFADVGNPEQLINKHYSSWTPEDLQKLIMIYGQGDNSHLTNLIFSREYNKVRELEEEER